MRTDANMMAVILHKMLTLCLGCIPLQENRKRGMGNCVGKLPGRWTFNSQVLSSALTLKMFLKCINFLTCPNERLSDLSLPSKGPILPQGHMWKGWTVSVCPEWTCFPWPVEQ